MLIYVNIRAYQKFIQIKYRYSTLTDSSSTAPYGLHTYRRFGDVSSHCNIFTSFFVGNAHSLFWRHCSQNNYKSRQSSQILQIT